MASIEGQRTRKVEGDSHMVGWVVTAGRRTGIQRKKNKSEEDRGKRRLRKVSIPPVSAGEMMEVCSSNSSGVQAM